MAIPRRRLLTLLAVIAVGVSAAWSGPVATSGAASARPPDTGDVKLFAAIVDRLRSGEAYYDAVGIELRARNYPTAQVFNWRTPFLLSAIAASPSIVPHLILVAAGIVMCFLTIAFLRPAVVAVTAGVLQLGSVALIAVPASQYLGEVWAGVMVGLSVCAYLRHMPVIASALGLVALLVRELAAPYCVVCTLAAVGARRRREVAMWAVGVCLYAAYYLWHVTEVRAHQLPTDMAHAESWLQFGGIPFLMSSISSHSWLFVAPQAVAVGALMLLVSGIAHVATPFHVRLVSASYIAFFLIAGQAFNAYWAFLVWPTWAIACGYGAKEVVDVVLPTPWRSKA